MGQVLFDSVESVNRVAQSYRTVTERGFPCTGVAYDMRQEQCHVSAPHSLYLLLIYLIYCLADTAGISEWHRDPDREEDQELWQDFERHTAQPPGKQPVLQH